MSYATLLVEKIIHKNSLCSINRRRHNDDLSIGKIFTYVKNKIFQQNVYFGFFLFQKLTEWCHFLNLFIERPS